jgi:hypothetical protein
VRERLLPFLPLHWRHLPLSAVSDSLGQAICATPVATSPPACQVLGPWHLAPELYMRVPKAHGQRRPQVLVDITITHTHIHACWRIAQREPHGPSIGIMLLFRTARQKLPLPRLLEGDTGGFRKQKQRLPGNHRLPAFCAILLSLPSHKRECGPELAGGVCARGCRASLCAGSAALLALPRWRRIALRTNGGRPTHT